MIGSPELVRCPVCGSRKIYALTIGASDMYCYCRGEGTLMESVDDPATTLSDPDEDRYSFDLPTSEPVNVELLGTIGLGAEANAEPDSEHEMDAVYSAPGARHKISAVLRGLGKNFRAKSSRTH